MAMPLEEEIMGEVGLGQHYNWYNGSGSCRYIRQDAIRKLPDAIEKHVKAGDKILPYDNRFTQVLEVASRLDENEHQQYSLTKVWEVMSYTIAAHIHGAYEGSAEPDNTLKYLRKTYAPPRDRERDFMRLRALGTNASPKELYRFMREMEED